MLKKGKAFLFDFFLTTWPDQYAKMTLSEYSLYHLAASIPFVYSLGFKQITGVNLAEGDFNWDDDELIRNFIVQLEQLKHFYLKNPQYTGHLFDKEIAQCAAPERSIRKWCGIGEGMTFFDYDGRQYPCPYCTPMTFSYSELKRIQRTDFHNPSEFLDRQCYDHCYIYPICSTCAGGNYQTHHTFKKRAKNKCRIQKLLALFSADYWAKKLTSQRVGLSNSQTYYTIEAIKQIRTLYLPEFIPYMLKI
ncbi:MAG: hypothetical protein ACTTJ4_08225 [Treponema sp.]|uniref:hypothetical protein n=1 Tax=Treponema sp. TaxID=166 RepID=UPI003FA1E9AF